MCGDERDPSPNTTDLQRCGSPLRSSLLHKQLAQLHELQRAILQTPKRDRNVLQQQAAALERRIDDTSLPSPPLRRPKPVFGLNTAIDLAEIEWEFPPLSPQTESPDPTKLTGSEEHALRRREHRRYAREFRQAGQTQRNSGHWARLRERVFGRVPEEEDPEEPVENPMEAAAMASEASPPEYRSNSTRSDGIDVKIVAHHWVSMGRKQVVFYQLRARVAGHYHCVWHRYNDFVALHQQVCGPQGFFSRVLEVCTARPPLQLPPTKWWHNLSPGFVQQRRAALEAYLEALCIIASQDNHTQQALNTFVGRCCRWVCDR